MNLQDGKSLPSCLEALRKPFSLNDEIMTTTADLIFCEAVQDLAKKTGQALAEVRRAAIESRAYEALYDPETGMWGEGPDSFAEFIKRDRPNSIQGAA
ncbi:hypothetical protein [uncultured Adlercreutzia sp.]|uniref:hypothetical protein n=1 Tax=uncultured Adlercreutzia sp. TaxID=875803 RepID=UPI0025DC3356|nr:hypothetical protein [uncultured Adlercreutzia sp.]MCI9262516.1 hypothetical protein [Eggerthellaceae bacterium]